MNLLFLALVTELFSSRSTHSMISSTMARKSSYATLTLTTLAMLAFAANSVLCRLALGADTIDAASFTSIRLLSGAAMLAIILFYRNRSFGQDKPNPVSALMLFTYAICFSFSYIQLSTGTGALILFGTVQLTLMLSGLLKGERPVPLAWLGMVAAFSGLVYLLLPSVSAPPLDGSALMILAGIAWGIYTLRGKGSKDPLSATSWNFLGTIPLVALTYVVFRSDFHLSQEGIVLAVASGALASGLGYVIWYSVLPRLSWMNAATVQLSVPVIAAAGGVILIAEPVTVRLVIATLVVLGGIYLTIRSATPRS
jgi:drug/metabolite transporter (DMT)-like permease